MFNETNSPFVHKNLTIPEEIADTVRKLVILYLIGDKEQKYNVLFEPGSNSKFLEKSINDLYNKGLLDIDKNNNFTYFLSGKGCQEYKHILELRKACMLEYMIYQGVDIVEGRFALDESGADLIDSEGNLIWEDCRVAVAMWEWHKNGSPLEGTAKNPWMVVLLNHLSHGLIDQIISE